MDRPYVPAAHKSPPHNVAAWALKAKQRPLVVGNAPYTSPPRDCIVIKVIDVAINPIDWIMQGQAVFGLEYPTVFGLDISGEIFELGDGVAESERWHPGMRVIAHGNVYTANAPSHGAFQKYAVVPKFSVAELPYKIPTSLGVVLPLGISTAAAGLYQKHFLSLPYPTSHPAPLNRAILIWGGSSSVGSCAIQLAVASGVTHILTTASRRNFGYCEGLGAGLCFDYHDNDVEEQIAEALEGKTVVGAFHAVGGQEAVKSCARIVDRAAGKAVVVTVRGVPAEGIPGSVRARSISSSTIFQSDVGPYIWRKFLPEALESGQIKPAPQPLTVGEELRSIQLGLDRQKKGVSAAKVVVTNIS